MGNEVNIVITGDDQSGAAFVSATAHVREYQRSSEQAGHAASEAIDEVADSADLATIFLQQMVAEFNNLLAAAGAAAGGGASEAISETAAAADDAAEAASEMANEVGDALGEVTAEATAAAAATDQLAENVSEVNQPAELAATAGGLHEVAAEAHDAAEAVDDIGNAGRWARIRAFITGLIPSMAEVRTHARSMGTSLTEGIFEQTDRLPDGIAGAIRSAGPAGAAAAAAAGTVLGGYLAAAIAGVLIGGAGLMGIGVGIAAAVKDPLVTDALGDLKAVFAREFADIGQVFRGPVVNAINTIQSAFAKMDFANVLAPLASAVEPLTNSLVGMVQAALPGFQKLIEAGGALLTGLGDDFISLGETVGDFAGHLASAGPAATSALEGLVFVLGNLVDWVGLTVEGLALLWQGLVNVAEAVGLVDTDSVESDYVRLLEPVNQNAIAFQKLAEANKQAAEAQEAARQAAEDLHNSLRGILDGAIALQESIWQLSDSVKENGTSLDMTNKKGMENVKIIAAMVDAANQQADAARESSKASGDAANAESKANAVRDAAIAKIIEQATAMGLDRNQVVALIASLQGLPTGDRYLNYTVRTIYQVQRDQAIQRELGSGYAGQAQAAGMSTGGEVTGSGTPTSDSEIRRLSVGEHVMTAAEVQAAGGHRAIYRLRQSLMAGRASTAVSDTASAGIGAMAGSGGATFVINNYSLDPQTAGDSIVRALETWTQSNGTLPSNWIAA